MISKSTTLLYTVAYGIRYLNLYAYYANIIVFNFLIEKSNKVGQGVPATGDIFAGIILKNICGDPIAERRHGAKWTRTAQWLID